MNFSINVQLGVWLDDLRLPLKQAMQLIAPLRVEAIGIDAFGNEVSPRALGASARRDLAQFIRSRGAALSALRVDVGGRRLADAQTLDVNLARIREALQLASDLGASHLVVAGGFIPPVAEKENASARATLTEAARTLVNLASVARTRIAWLGGQEAPEVLADFLQQVDSSAILEVDLNPGAYVMRGLDPLKALGTLSSRVAIARAADHYRGGAEAPFGAGDVRWNEVLIGLSTLNRPAPLPVLGSTTLEGDRAQALANTFKRLLALRKKPV
ncbi:MAG TPA: hypothetical protein VEK08_02390 [Planctomycetota bacterium]|nr:hypothetical protein [Planctomycetota bacterium]